MGHPAFPGCQGRDFYKGFKSDIILMKIPCDRTTKLWETIPSYVGECEICVHEIEPYQG